MAYRVLVCGSRDWDDPYAIWCVLNGYLSDDVGLVVIQGGAEGADKAAKDWAAHNDVTCETYPADWEQHGRAAGPRRNAFMLTESKPDLVWAFVNKPLAESRGTADLVQRARVIVPTYVVKASRPGPLVRSGGGS